MSSGRNEMLQSRLPGAAPQIRSDLGMMGPHYFIYGPPGSGKTTLGRLLAQSLRLPFWDLDAEIEAHSGMAIPEIFTAEEETGFRRREKGALSEVLAHGAGVIALGGGALLDEENRNRVESAGEVLCLRAGESTLLERLQAAQDLRPLLSNKGQEAGESSPEVVETRLKELLYRRRDHYASFPLQLDTGDRPPEPAAWEAQILLGAFHVVGMGAGYDVRVHSGGLARVGEALRQRGLQGPLALVSDENVSPIYAARVIDSLRASGYQVGPVTIPAGEAYKNIETVAGLWKAFVDLGLERRSTVIALGGGVAGDLAGFAAATFLRGVHWVALPTSLLAMVDASLGGKTGADLAQGKNLVGAFHAPSLVLADPQTLGSLPETELRSGMAEVVKHGLIGDARLLEICSQGWGAVQSDWNEVVRRAMAVKIHVIQADPYEQGLRAALNLGHTIGHAIELASRYQIRHGEAVAIGLVAEARLAEKMGLAVPGLSGSIANILAGLGLPTEIPAHLSHRAIIQGMGVDKKRADGKIRFSLPVKAGETKLGVALEDLRLLEEIFTPGVTG